MKIEIYVEGGGGSKEQKAFLRQGFEGFLCDLRAAARAKRCGPKIIMCGSREDTFAAFKDACERGKDTLGILLVDSEGPVSTTPRRHLSGKDRWPVEFARDEQLQLMVQTMETWLVADPESLERFYGQGFHASSLPKAKDLESTPKDQIEQALVRATEKTSQGRYHKIRHASKLLALIDAKKVRERCAHCARLVSDLQAIIGRA